MSPDLDADMELLSRSTSQSLSAPALSLPTFPSPISRVEEDSDSRSATPGTVLKRQTKDQTRSSQIALAPMVDPDLLELEAALAESQKEAEERRAEIAASEAKLAELEAQKDQQGT